MQFLGWATLLLAFSAPAYATQDESSKDQTIEELQRKIEALEARLGKLESPPQESGDPKAAAGLEARLDETIRQNRTEGVREPMRLNMTAPRDLAVEIDGQLRVIGNYWGGYNSFNGNEDDSLSFGESVDLGFNFKVSENTRAYVSLHDGRIWGDTPAPGLNEAVIEDGTENFYLNEAYVETKDFMSSGVDLSFGRMKLEYGAERQLGDDEWLLNRTSFNGFVFTNDMGGGQMADVGLIRLGDGDTFVDSEIFPGGAIPGADTTQAEMYYVYYTNKSEDLGTLDGYVFYVDGDAFSNTGAGQPIPNGERLDTRYFTYGARWAHNAGMIYWDAEFATQFGKFLGVRTDDYGFETYALYARAGLDLEDVEFVDKVYVGYDQATGDGNADNEQDQYIQLFPSLHGWFGIMDFASWSNVTQYLLGASFTVDENSSVDVSYRFIELENDMAPFGGYNFGVGGGTDNGHQVGQEADVVYSVKCGESSHADAGVGVFLPDEVYKAATGDNDEVWFAYLQYVLRF